MLNRLPRLAVDSVVGMECVGKAEPSKWVGYGWIVGLRVGDRFIWGRFVRVDSATGAVRVQLDDATDVTALKVGESYPFIDSYWGRQAELVLDKARSWRRRAFQPVDAFRYGGDAQRIMSKAEPGREGGALVPGGWDHEHCEVCNQTIRERGPSVGWVSEPDRWLCEGCYEKYVVPRSIEFVNIE
jgi:hypothetical protein